MLVTLTAFAVGIVPALLQGAVPARSPAAAPQVTHSLSSKDSTRTLRAVRRAQSDFELIRRQLLPLEALRGTGDCEAVVGRYCYRQQFTVAPPEAPALVAARERLLAMFESAAEHLPGDRWVVGQRVRYLLEAGRANEADSIAIACAAGSPVPETAAWCLALIGYTAQRLGSYHRADAAYDKAFARMRPEDRCAWQDLRVLFGRAAGPYRRGDCSARDSATANFWRLVQPLYLNDANDLRTEMLARITRLYIEQGTRTPSNDWWGPDDRATVLRYGAPIWYTRGERLPGDLRPPIASYRREPSFNFFPDTRVFASADRLSDDDWHYWNVATAPTYAPLWADSFLPLTEQQVALFHRGDSALVVAAFDANDGAPARATRRLGVFTAVIDGGGVLPPTGTTMEQSGFSVVTTLTAPWRPLVVSLEGLNTASRTAIRARFAVKPPATTGRLSLSDLLFYEPSGSPPAALAEVVPRMLHAARAPVDRQVGMFWETYGARDGERFDCAIVVEPVEDGLLHRAMVKLRLAEPERTVVLRWQEVASGADGIMSRGVTVDLSRLRPGRYLVRLLLGYGAEQPVVSERTIDVY